MIPGSNNAWGNSVKTFRVSASVILSNFASLPLAVLIRASIINFIHMKIKLFSASFLFLAASVFAYSQENAEITVNELRQHISYLASDQLQGRLPGTEGDRLSASYIREEFEKAGIELIAQKGYQFFDVVTHAEAGRNNTLRAGSLEASLNEDFTPLSFSKSSGLTASAVFAGYGFRVENDTLNWDDYEGIDVGGKWVIILRGEPLEDDSESPFSGQAGLREKVLTAKDMGAGGVIFVSGPSFDEDDALVRMFYDKTTADAGIPVFHARRHFVDSLVGVPISALEKKIRESMAPHSHETETTVYGVSDVVHQKVKTMNVVGMVEGTDSVLKEQFIVLGAHYDHLGMGGPGSGSREPDTHAVHNGADDNASGVAGIIEIAEKIASDDHRLKRSLVVVAFGAEEMGLIGSKYFVEHPVIEMDDVVAMFNFDMIGRLNDERSVVFGGTGTSKESEDIINKNLELHGMKGSFSREGFGPSDHAAFYAEDIPVFFISTGPHQDYHTPQDDVGLIDFDGQKAVAELSYDLIAEVANRDAALSFREAGSKSRSARSYNFKVTLGIVPDFTSSENNGLGVGGVRVDGPADKAGMEKGDRIIALDGMEVTNIYDYMGRLKKLEPGQIITVDIIREGEKVVLLVQL